MYVWYSVRAGKVRPEEGIRALELVVSCHVGARSPAPMEKVVSVLRAIPPALVLGIFNIAHFDFSLFLT